MPRRTSTRTRRTRGAGCARSTSPNVATSQNTVEPPLPSTISQPSGRPNSDVRPLRTSPTRFLTGAWRCDVPSTVREAAATASICSARTFDGPQPKRPSAGSSSRRDRQLARGVSGHSLSIAADRVRLRPTRPRSDVKSGAAPMNRVSARLAAIAESATLAVDAKAKALQAAGEDVIGFGAGEPDFPTPQAIVDAAVAACSDPRNHKYTPAAGLPELREAIAVKTKRDSGFDCAGSQVLVTNGGKHAVFTAFAALVRPRRRGARARPVLDDVPGGDHARRRGAEDHRDDRGDRIPGDGRSARRGVDAAHQGAALREPRQPVGCRVPAAAGRGDRPVGRREGRLGHHRRDLRTPHVRAAPASCRCRWSCPTSPSSASCSTASPRRTR